MILPLWMVIKNKTMFKKIIGLFCLVLCTLAAFSQELPPRSNTLVTDFTNALSPTEKQQLEAKLVAFNDSTSTQIAVVLMKSVGDYDINEYGQKLGRAWGIGQKGKNNGILVLAALGDRKITIQTGLGAEGAVPDIITHQIIQNDIKPHFKASDYYGGLDAATNDLIKYIKGEYKADKKVQDQDKSVGAEGAVPDIITHQIIQNDIKPHFKASDYYGGLDAATNDLIKYIKGEYKADKKVQDQDKSGGSVVAIIIIIVFILILIFRNRGGGGQIIDSRGGASPFWWFLGGAMLGRESGGWGGFSGGDSGGGSNSGGFGGFGGGDFGGGGSSGSW